jgi:hypothetical protein
MAKISAPAVRDITERYRELYLDNDRMTEAELASLKDGLSAEEMSFVDELNAAIMPDDVLTAEEIDSFRYLPDFMRGEFKREIAPDFACAWFDRIAAKIPHRWYRKDVSADDAAQIGEALSTFDREKTDPRLLMAIDYYAVLIAQNAMADAIIALNESYIVMADALVGEAKGVMQMKMAVVAEFGTPKQVRETTPLFRREFRELRRDLKEEKNGLKALNREIRHQKRRNWQPRGTD